MSTINHFFIKYSKSFVNITFYKVENDKLLGQDDWFTIQIFIYYLICSVTRKVFPKIMQQLFFNEI